MSARGAAGVFLDFIPNCFLVSYSCTAYQVYSTVVCNYLNLMKHCPGCKFLDFFFFFFQNQRTSGYLLWKKEEERQILKNQIQRILNFNF
jgi:hypothetical protein